MRRRVESVLLNLPIALQSMPLWCSRSRVNIDANRNLRALAICWIIFKAPSLAAWQYSSDQSFSSAFVRLCPCLCPCRWPRSCRWLCSSPCSICLIVPPSDAYGISDNAESLDLDDSNDDVDADVDFDADCDVIVLH